MDEGLSFNAKETEILREVFKFLNEFYSVQNYIRGNQPPPDFNKERLTPEELKAFWAKLEI